MGGEGKTKVSVLPFSLIFVQGEEKKLEPAKLVIDHGKNRKDGRMIFS